MVDDVPMIRPKEPRVKMRQRTARPTNKVTAGAVADACTILIVYAMSAAFGVELPRLVQMALMLLIGFGASYLTPPSDADIPDVAVEE